MGAAMKGPGARALSCLCRPAALRPGPWRGPSIIGTSASTPASCSASPSKPVACLPSPSRAGTSSAGATPRLPVWGTGGCGNSPRPDWGGLVYAESLATLLALHLLRPYGAQPPRPCPHTGGLSSHKLRLVQEYIHAHLDQPLGLADLAALVHFSTPHFLRMFKQSTGQAPHQYVLAQRLERARAYLHTSRLSMTEIALHLGFRTQSHCTMPFRRLTGLAPTAYRQVHGVQRSLCSALEREPRGQAGGRDGSAARRVS